MARSRNLWKDYELWKFVINNFQEVFIMFTKEWFKAAAVRAVKTVAQTAIATIGTSVLISEVNWIAVVSASLLAGALSILTSVAGLPEVQQKGE